MPGQLDPFTLALFRNAMISLGDQMALTIYRTSYSSVLKDIMDTQRPCVMRRDGWSRRG
jgi:N-methylhydantoinase B